MADVVAALLPDIELYLNITWKDEQTDKKITGYINRGMKRLQDIVGASLDFMAEDSPRSLLFDYCRYANSQAFEVFEQNFQADLLELNLSTQAPIISGLVAVLLPNSVSGSVTLTVSPSIDERNSYVYRIGTALTVPERMDQCAPPTYTDWNGYSPIPAASGQEILIVEVNDQYEAVRAGKVTVI